MKSEEITKSYSKHGITIPRIAIMLEREIQEQSSKLEMVLTSIDQLQTTKSELISRKQKLPTSSPNYHKNINTINQEIKKIKAEIGSLKQERHTTEEIITVLSKHLSPILASLPKEPESPISTSEEENYDPDHYYPTYPKH